MEFQSVYRGLSVPSFTFPHFRVSANYNGLRNQRLRNGVSFASSCLKRSVREFSFSNLNRGAVLCASDSSSDAMLETLGRENSGLFVKADDGLEPFRGKSGAVSFHGLTHQLIEEGKLVSAPFNEEKGSLFWVLAPVALLSSLLLPQFFLGDAIEALLKDETLIEIVTTLSFEIIFYIGLATFLWVADRVQRPYIQFSAKRWGLITGLRGYLTSAFFTMGLKIITPLFAVSVTWPVVGLPALVSVVPFLFGCFAQFAFERILDKRGSSCWPLVPIIFEVYRIYQLTKAASFMERLMLPMKGIPATPEVLERGGAIFAMIMTFNGLGMVCLWSLMTFLLRLFPSRPVAENY